MTTLPVAERRPAANRTGRLIVVGVRDAERDAAALAWAQQDAVGSADALYLVHAAVPSCRGDTAERRSAAARQLAHAVEQLSVARPDLPVYGAVPAALPGDALIELSSRADLLVVGSDTPGTALATGHVALRVQQHARCPVVCVPPDFESHHGPVTVAAETADLPQEAMRFAANHAQRHGATMQVALPWAALAASARPGVTWLAHQQEELDAQLASWREWHPRVPIVARIELDDDWLPNVAAYSSLLVLPARALAGDQRSADPVRVRCATVIVPECAPFSCAGPRRR